jgi:hypothetical protein
MFGEPEKPQMSPAEEADAWMHAEMLVALFERLNASLKQKGVDVRHIGDSYEDPDFVQDPSTGRMMGSRAKGILSKEKFQAAVLKAKQTVKEKDARKEEIGRAVDEVVEAEGFDRSKLKISYEYEEAEYNGKFYKVQGKYNPGTGEITIFPETVGLKESNTFFQAVTAHEITHDKFAVAMQAYRREIDKPVSMAPVIQKLSRYFTPDSMMKLQTDDGVTDYSKDFWEAYKSDHTNGSWQTSANETLAEMSAEKYRTGKLPGSKIWKDFHRDVAALYPVLKDAR